MSADNGYVVSRVRDQKEKWGIFHYSGSGDDSPRYYFTIDRAYEVHNTPVHAIVAAHRIERDNHTEYGVTVSHLVLEDCERFGF